MKLFRRWKLWKWASFRNYLRNILAHCNIASNDYQQDSRVLYLFVPNKSFGQLLDISPKNSIFSNTFNSESSYIEVWFTDQRDRRTLQSGTNHAKRSAINAFKSASKRTIPKTAEATGDLTANKTADKITIFSNYS